MGINRIFVIQDNNSTKYCFTSLDEENIYEKYNINIWYPHKINLPYSKLRFKKCDFVRYYMRLSLVHIRRTMVLFLSHDFLTTSNFSQIADEIEDITEGARQLWDDRTYTAAARAVRVRRKIIQNIFIFKAKIKAVKAYWIVSDLLCILDTYVHEYRWKIRLVLLRSFGKNSTF